MHVVQSYSSSPGWLTEGIARFLIWVEERYEIELVDALIPRGKFTVCSAAPCVTRKPEPVVALRTLKVIHAMRNLSYIGCASHLIEFPPTHQGDSS